MTTPEGETKDAIKKLFKGRADLFPFWPVQMGYGQAIIDCLLCCRGRYVGIECKKEGVDEPTSRQAKTMTDIRAAGGVTYLVTIKNGELEWIEIK